MDDKRIVDLFWERSETALAETEKKYGSYCHRIAMNILSNELDAEECVNDAYLKAWESIPPHRPQRLSTFLGKITRNISLNRYAHNNAQKRCHETALVYEELAELVSERADNTSDEGEIGAAINGFLSSLSAKSRIIFVQRYWYLCPIKEIAQNRGLSESDVKITLMRTRRKLKKHLEKEGITV